MNEDHGLVLTLHYDCKLVIGSLKSSVACGFSMLYYFSSG